jgi:chromosome segregation ATPase
VMAAVGMMALMPATSIAMTTQPSATTSRCPCTTVMPEARILLNAVRWDAQKIANRADSLENSANTPNSDRTAQSNQLQRIQAKLRDMDSRLGRLEEIKQSLPAPDHQATNEAIFTVRLMQRSTTAAIGDLEAGIQYGGYAKVLNDEAQTLAREMHTAEHSVDLQERAAYDQENLGMLLVFGK